nr:MAG TPA: hypothetical protein [Caudoviricetes sp.]
MNITEKVITMYHTLKGVVKVRINFKNKVYKTNDFLVEMYVGLLVTGKKTIEQVPNYGNLRVVVQSEVDRINREWEEKEKAKREELERIEKEREGHAE